MWPFSIFSSFPVTHLMTWVMSLIQSVPQLPEISLCLSFPNYKDGTAGQEQGYLWCDFFFYFFMALNRNSKNPNYLQNKYSPKCCFGIITNSFFLLSLSYSCGSYSEVFNFLNTIYMSPFFISSCSFKNLVKYKVQTKLIKML